MFLLELLAENDKNLTEYEVVTFNADELTVLFGIPNNKNQDQDPCIRAARSYPHLTHCHRLFVCNVNRISCENMTTVALASPMQANC